MRHIKYIVLHNNGTRGKTVGTIRRYHMAPKPRGKGWSDIGYHHVLHEDGIWHRGRPERRAGAGVKGLNTNAIHLCVIGNGNKADFNGAQYVALMVKLQELCAAYPEAIVIGHREANDYLPNALHTRKRCPGALVDMDFVRLLAAEGRAGWVAA